MKWSTHQELSGEASRGGVLGQTNDYIDELLGFNVIRLISTHVLRHPAQKSNQQRTKSIDMGSGRKGTRLPPTVLYECNAENNKRQISYQRLLPNA